MLLKDDANSIKIDASNYKDALVPKGPVLLQKDLIQEPRSKIELFVLIIQLKILKTKLLATNLTKIIFSNISEMGSSFQWILPKTAYMSLDRVNAIRKI